MQDDWEEFKDRLFIILGMSLLIIILAVGMYYDIMDDNTNDMVKQNALGSNPFFPYKTDGQDRF